MSYLSTCDCDGRHHEVFGSAAIQDMLVYACNLLTSDMNGESDHRTACWHRCHREVQQFNRF